MADIHSKEVRSYNMSRIKSKDTAPELLVRKYLHGLGFRYTLHNKNLPGKPDIVLPKYNTVIFVHGCFWHGHANCKYASIPKTRTAWWQQKIETNKSNDVRSIRLLKKTGYKCIHIWGCQLKKDKVDKTLEKVVNKLQLITDI